MILYLFAFLSGLVTIFAPCIWPLLPIILSSSTTGGKRKPLGITLGIMLSFAFFTLSLSYILKIIPFDPNILRYFAVIVIGFLGLTLIIPALNQIVEGFVSRLTSKTGVNQPTNDTGFKGGLITGFSLGLVWSPCAGPILATIATLSATQAVNLKLVFVTLAYVTGVGIPLLIFSTVGQRIFTQSRKVNKYTGRIQQVFGVIMILTALSILTNYDKVIQVKLLNAFPSYSTFLNKLESNEAVTKELSDLRENKKMKQTMFNTGKNQAPDFVGVEKWLNTEKDLTMADLKGKVVLIDFWTYTCINCIRTFPYVQGWYDKYKNDGFVIIGVHTPEFPFEKKTENVQQALKQYGLTYPVAQDNDFKTWDAYNNQYWPAHYLIDAEGNIRYTHFGEGKYDETEKKIQELLQEAGKKVKEDTLKIQDNTPTTRNTPETYLGLNRMERQTNNIINTGVQSLELTSDIPDNFISFGGEWNVQPQYSESVSNSVLSVHFQSGKVFLVITPAQAEEKVKVTLDGKPLPNSIAGKDVKNGVMNLDVARLYDIVDLKGRNEKHILKFEFMQEGTQVYAFTFGT